MSAASLLADPALWAPADLPFLPLPDARASLACYIDLLIRWNKRLNLSGYQDAEGIARHLLPDSFYLAQFIERLRFRLQWNHLRVIDVGAGAGIPGIPLRIFWQRGQYTLVEKRAKRAIFMQNILARLKLPRTYVFNGAAESFFAGNPPAQCILSRAFMPWPALLPFCAGALTPDGIIIIMANEPPPVNGICAADRSSWRVIDSLRCQLARKCHWLWAAARDKTS